MGIGYEVIMEAYFKSDEVLKRKEEVNGLEDYLSSRQTDRQTDR